MYAANILKAFDACTPEELQQGETWYQTARADCERLALDLKIPAESVIGAAAAISPGMRWSLVVAHVGMLHQAMRNKKKHSVPTYCTLFVNRARAILKGKAPLDVLRGPKVTAFYRAIVAGGKSGDVVIDGHAWNIALGTSGHIRRSESSNVTMPYITAKRYRDCADAYREVAALRGVPPCTVQAATWINHRTGKGLHA